METRAEDLGAFGLHLNQALGETNVMVPRHVYKSLFEYWQILNEWNAKINLTRVSDMKGFISKHIVDSLALLYVSEDRNTLLDIGSGAGFPGLVLAIARPEWAIHLVEKVEKKSHFLKEVRRRISLQRVWVQACRVEELAGKLRYQIVTGRAAAEPPAFAKLARPFIEENGILVLFLQNVEPPELDGYSIEKVFEYWLPFGGQKRKIASYRLA